MVRVFPFKGLRPLPENASEIASPPYDVLNAREAKEIVTNSPNSFLKVNKAECDFDTPIEPNSKIVYQKAKDNLQSLINRGLMVQDQVSCFYMYKLTFNKQSQTGLCCVMAIEDYENGLIKKHEHTRPDKVKDRANHINYLGAQVGPVFSIFKNNNPIDELFEKLTEQKPEILFKSEDGVIHEFWVIQDLKMIESIQINFKNLSCTYIADGHHRSESAAEVVRQKFEYNKHRSYGSYEYFLNVLFPDNQVKILPYNRIVKKPEGTTVKEILKRARTHFNIMINKGGKISPDTPHTFSLYAEGVWYKLELLDGQLNNDDPVCEIDAEVLQQYFIDPILEISDPKIDNRIQFVGGIRGNDELKKYVDSGEYDIAFSLYPTTVHQLLRVADAQKVMPPKSTWFEPKLRSGMVVHLLENLE